ncbi:hypothetical protein F3Y22_tig00110258pilonHSYRG00201 [Hibiscus syriacus]|uniref:Agglutinin domain-containing protein n=1 Tax=Hibiscus syriacus TaxID=106335 RepID=A0A6A3B5E5_HIBSY|nr:uncharacterized protein LOC120115200 [Hibiscus syriacus]KAE8712344.1 hypothetical protein F3Y22_tig00110258pilonHSYRG00201 [Hibiscus syriacus]
MASELTLVLPRFVALKGDNGQYMCVVEFNRRPHLQFTASDISDPNVAMEILPANDGKIRIRHISSGKFWNLGNPDFILADADKTSDSDNNTLFRPFNVNTKSIAFLNLGNNKFCKRYTGSLTSGFNAMTDITDFFARLKVEETVTKREISNIKYRLDKSRVYDNETVVLVEKSAINSDPNSSTTEDLTLSYEDVKSNIWKTNLSLKLEAKGTFDITSFPIIVDGGRVQSLNQGQRGNELDGTMITTTRKKVVHKVVVPPNTKVVLSLTTTKGKCDVPFTFTQRDTLINGNTYTTEVEDATYTVSNYYNLQFQTREEPIDA